MARSAGMVAENPVEVNPDAPQMHVRFDGRSFDIPLGELDVGAGSTDDQIRNAVARFLETPAVKLQAFAIDRNQATGDLTLRPEAVFGGPDDDGDDDD